MPQFWKLGIGKRKQDDCQSGSGSPKSPAKHILNGNVQDDTGSEGDPTTSPRRLGGLRSLVQEESLLGDLGKTSEEVEPTWGHCSRLSKTLDEVLHDKGALGYFIQFMESQEALSYIKFWLEAESFCASASPQPVRNGDLVSGARNFSVNRGREEEPSQVQTHSKEDPRDSSASTEVGAGAVAVTQEETVKNDAERVFQRFIAEGAPQSVHVGEHVREAMRTRLCVDGDGGVDPDCFLEAQGVVYKVMEKEYFPDFLRSDYHCKHQIDVLTSGRVFLTDVVYNEVALFYFMEFMEQEGQCGLVEFWLAADNFRQHYTAKKGAYDGLEAQNDAMVLYDRYFSLQATSPLGFGDKVRLEVEHRICREGGPLPNCFNLPLKIVFCILEKNFLPSFLTSQLYLNYLSELMNTIQSSPSLLGRKKRSGSDSTCSSEQSISVQNTLLAMEGMHVGGAHHSRVVRNVDNRSMTIDSRQLYDPDSLWRRRHMSKLSIGRINDLGKFETEIEPEPDRKGESRLSKAVKRLVNLEESKTKEEMAWQIAEMIVKDITNVTMGLNSGGQEPPKES